MFLLIGLISRHNAQSRRIVTAFHRCSAYKISAGAYARRGTRASSLRDLKLIRDILGFFSPEESPARPMILTDPQFAIRTCTTHEKRRGKILLFFLKRLYDMYTVADTYIQCAFFTVFNRISSSEGRASFEIAGDTKVSWICTIY